MAEEIRQASLDSKARELDKDPEAKVDHILEPLTPTYNDEGVIDTNSIASPLYIYAGLADPLLTNNDINDWNIYYTNADVIKRVYPGEGHDVQYRHLDQILIDIKFKGNKILICNNDQEK